VQPEAVATSPSVPSTAAEKVALFRSRFRGREDIYPRFWTNARTGRKGYAPACGNEWVREVCEKPRVKCGECPNQAFLLVENQVILDHLQGRHVVGVYPLLSDETCWFLAADFDKTSWIDDVAAFVETCRANALPAAVERSRSGNGAHVWFFFSEPVAAATARKMGCYLITETMSRRHQLSMESYDRLFPNQDTLPRGGFGNLIALPLQHGPRQMGNTVFVDDRSVPHPDQWEFLSRHPRIRPATAESVAREATHRGLVVGVRLSDTTDTESSEPWTRLPSGQPPVRFAAPLPREVRAVLAQRLFVAKSGLAPNRSTLVLVHRQPLLDQWIAQLSMFLGVAPKAVGQIGAGKHRPNGRLDVAMIQSLVRKDKVHDLVASYGQVIVDECHHLPAVSFERVLAEAKARYVVGLTATPQRRDGHHPITEMQLGPVRFAIDPKSQAAQRPFVHKLVVRETMFKTSSEKTPSIQELYAALAADDKRNRLILDDVIQALEQGRCPILLTERKDHLEYFANRLGKVARHLVVLQGGMGAKERRQVKARLAAIADTEERLVLATGRYVGEGFDDARLDTLFLALPVSWKGTLIQYTGRLHRLHSTKQEVRIFDYVDRDVPMLLRMFEKRLRGYRGIGYAKGEAPLGYAEPGDEIVVEYDENVLRSLKNVNDFA